MTGPLAATDQVDELLDAQAELIDMKHSREVSRSEWQTALQRRDKAAQSIRDAIAASLVPPVEGSNTR